MKFGASRSRNKGIELAKGDIVVLCDDDVIYNKDFKETILHEFEKNKEADIITFNLDSPNRKTKLNKSNKRLHFYNILRYTSPRIAFRTQKIKENEIKFNTLFGPGSKYKNGEEAIFLTECLRKKLKIFSSTKNIGMIFQDNSTWFNGYDENFFFNKGAIFTAINKRIRHFLFLQYLIRNRYVLKNISFINAYKNMIKGSNDYIKLIK